MKKKMVYEIFTIYGWRRTDRETYWNFKGRKRWRWEEEEDGAM